MANFHLGYLSSVTFSEVCVHRRYCEYTNTVTNYTSLMKTDWNTFIRFESIHIKPLFM